MSARLATLLLLIAVVGCRSSTPQNIDDAPARAALELLALAGGDPEAAALRPHLGRTPDASERTALLDALQDLDLDGVPTVAGISTFDGDRWAVVDLAGTQSDGVEIRLSVQLEAPEPGHWVVRWIAGPDVEWPSRGRRRGDGLTVSNPAP